MFPEFLIHPERLSLGVQQYAGQMVYALIYKKKSGQNYLVKSGKNLPVWIKFIVPLFAHADLSTIPSTIFVTDIGEEDPDAWIERQEAASQSKKNEDGQLISEYFVDSSTIYQVRTSIKARDTHYQLLQSNVQVCTLAPPLWDLAVLYWKEKQKPFVLWKISNEGSVLGFVDKGHLQKACHFWPDLDELLEKPKRIIQETLPLINSLTQHEKIPVILFSPEKIDFSSLNVKNEEILFEESPHIKGVELCFHEVYALGCHSKDEINFVQFEHVQKNKRMRIVWNGSVSAVRCFFMVLMVSLLLMWGSERGIALYEKMNHNSFKGIKEQIDNLKQAYTQRDSVLSIIKEKARFLAYESTVTSLLNDLQDIFPEEMWAEEITISDSDDNNYRIDIRAMAISSSLIGSFMEKLQKVKGIGSCRMVYSEQIATKNEKGIRFKIEAIWR